jgi:hypothetical protein
MTTTTDTVTCGRCGHPTAETTDTVPAWLARCADTAACDQRLARRAATARTTAIREIIVALHEAGYVHTVERGGHRWQLNSDQVSENIVHYVTFEPAPETLPDQNSLIIRNGANQLGWDGQLNPGHAADLLVSAGVLARCLRRTCDRLIPGDVVECARCAATSDAIAYDRAVDAADHGRHAAHEAA